MKNSTTLILVLALALLAGSPAAGTPSLPVGPQAGVPVSYSIVGGSTGNWDLPTGPSDGFASGLLTLGQGFPFYVMSVTLPATDVIQVGSQLTGTLTGGLISFPLPADGSFDLDVSGTWTVDPITGHGTFVAYFSQQISPTGPTILLGGMKGRFDDLDSPFGPDRLGTYKARWAFLD
jgi:hypothetical protein